MRASCYKVIDFSGVDSLRRGAALQFVIGRSTVQVRSSAPAFQSLPSLALAITVTHQDFTAFVLRCQEKVTSCLDHFSLLIPVLKTATIWSAAGFRN